MTDARRALVQSSLLGAAATAASVFVPLSYDEGDWLAVTRRLALGDTLYVDVLQNKPPPYIALVRGLDALPGPYTLARACFVGLCVVAVGMGVFVLCRRLGADAATARRLGLVLGGALMLQSAFVMDIEKPAALLVLAGVIAIAYTRPALGGVLVALACAFDIRAVLFTVGAVVFAFERSGRREAVRCGVACAAIAGGLGAFVASQPDVRYALIELNAATRVVSAYHPAEILVVTVAALLPVIAGAFVVLRAQPPRATKQFKAGIVMVATTIAIAVASRYPFYKYWALGITGFALSALALWPRVNPKTAPVHKPLAIAIVVGSFAPVAAHAITANIEQARITTRYERAAEFLDAALPEGGRFAAFDIQPFLGTYLPSKVAVHWGILDLVAVNTSRTTGDLERVARAIETADAVVDDGALSVSENAVGPHYRRLWKVFEDNLGPFSCIVRRDGLTFRFRPERCPT